MKDIRLVATSTALLAAIAGYIALILAGHASEAHDLLTLIGLPALTFIIGLGSSIVTD